MAACCIGNGVDLSCSYSFAALARSSGQKLPVSCQLPGRRLAPGERALTLGTGVASARLFVKRGGDAHSSTLRSSSRRNSTSCKATTGGGSGGDGTGGGGRGGGGGGGGSSGPGGNHHGGGQSHNPTGIALLWSKYLSSLDTNPVQVKAFTSMLLNLLGDLFCQVVIEKAEKLNWKRLGVTALLGFALVGPTLHFWYTALSKMVTATGTSGTVIRLALDQFVFSPSFICVFFTCLLTLEGRPQDIGPKLKQDWLATVVSNWKLWIPFQFLNFRLVPLNLQVAAANVIALAWNVYLSWASHKTVAGPAVIE
eukprot:jgi/Mesen1/7224/ME000372S06465